MRVGPHLSFCDSGLITENPVFKEILEGSPQCPGIPLPFLEKKLLFGTVCFLAHDKTLVPFDVPGAGLSLRNLGCGEHRDFRIFGQSRSRRSSYGGGELHLFCELTDTGTEVEHVLVNR